MIYICIILGVLLLAAIGYIVYLLKPPSKQGLYEEEFQRAAHEIEERLRKEREEQINFQSEQIRQEIHLDVNKVLYIQNNSFFVCHF